MKIHKLDVGAVTMAFALLGCPKKTDSGMNAAGSDDTPPNDTSAAMDREDDAVPGEMPDSDAGGSMLDPDAPGTQDMTQPDEDGGAPEPATVTWQGVRQDGLDVDHDVYSVDVDVTGAVFVGGTVKGPFAGSDYESWRLLVAKYGPDGTLAWTWEEDSLAGRGHVSSVSADDHGNVYFVGQTGTPLGNGGPTAQTDAFAGKLDEKGDLVWVKYVGTAAFDEAEASVVDSEGNLVLAGYAGGALPDQTEQSAAAGGFVTKLSPDGAHLWTRRQGGRLIDLSAAASGALYVGEEGPSVFALDSAGNTTWTSNIDDQSEIGDELDDPEGEYSGDLLGVATAADRDGSTLFVAGSYGGVGFQSVIYGFVGRLDPSTGELRWIAGLDSQVQSVTAAADGGAVYVTTVYDCTAFDANGAELWSVPLSGNALATGEAADLFLVGTTLFTNLTGTPGSGRAGARDWIVARLQQSDGGLL